MLNFLNALMVVFFYFGLRWHAAGTTQVPVALHTTTGVSR